MISDKAFNKLVDEIMIHGYDEKTAAHFARLIGDTPIVDADGTIVVQEGNEILAKLKLKFFPTTDSQSGKSQPL